MLVLLMLMMLMMMMMTPNSHENYFARAGNACSQAPQKGTELLKEMRGIMDLQADGQQFVELGDNAWAGVVAGLYETQEMAEIYDGVKKEQMRNGCGHCWGCPPPVVGGRRLGCCTFVVVACG